MKGTNPLDQARAAFRKAVTRTEVQSYESATLGWRKSETEVVLSVPGRPRHKYITKSDGTVTIALNEANVPLNAFLPVKIRLENNTLVIKGRDAAATNALANLPDSPHGVPSHPHAFLGLSDVLPTDLADGQLFAWDATAGKLVNVDAPGGAVDSVNGQTGIVNLDTDDVPEGATNKYLDAANLGTTIAGASETGTLVDTDKIPLVMGTTLMWAAWSTFKSALTTLFNGLYVGLTGAQSIAGLKTFANGISFGLSVLSHYSIDTWTPTDNSGAGLTFAQANGTYIRIGRFVVCLYSVAYPATASGSQAILGGLPFTPASIAGTTGGGGFVFLDTANLAAYRPIVLTSGSITFGLFGGGSVTNAQLSGSTIRHGVLYFTS
jgi:hypothetical protein